MTIVCKIEKSKVFKYEWLKIKTHRDKYKMIHVMYSSTCTLFHF